MTTTHAAAAKEIRQELKKHGIPATVRSKSYSGGSSIDVTIGADLCPAAVKQVEAFCGRYQQGHFDGMQDLYVYSNESDLPQVKFVFVHIDYSDEIREAAKAYIAEIDGINEWERDRYEWMALNGSWGDFWSSRKPRVRVAA